MKNLLRKLPIGAMIIALMLFMGMDGYAQLCTLDITTQDVCFDNSASANVNATTNGDNTCPPAPISFGPTSGWYCVSANSANLSWHNYPRYSETMDITVTEPGEYVLRYYWDADNHFTKSINFYSSPEINLSTQGNDLGCEVMQISYFISSGDHAVPYNVTSSVWTATDGVTTVTLPNPTESPFTFDPAWIIDNLNSSFNTCGNFTVYCTAVNNGSYSYPPDPQEDTPPACDVVEELNFDIVLLATNVDAGGGVDNTVEFCEDDYYPYYEGTVTGSFDGTEESICGPLTVLWISLDPGITFTYGSETTLTPTFKASQCGSYTLRMTVLSGGLYGCEVYDEVEVEFYDLPDNVDAGDDQEVCEVKNFGYETEVDGSFDEFECTHGVNPTVSWTIEDQPSGSNAWFYIDYWGDTIRAVNVNPTSFYADTCGTYTLKYTVWNHLQGCDESDLIDINFIALPANIAITPPDNINNICGLSTTLRGDYEQPCEVLLDDPNTVEWSTVDGPGDVSWSVTDYFFTTVTVTEYGTYEFKYKVTNELGCWNDTSEFINFYEQPNPVIVDEYGSCSQLNHTVYTCSEVDYYVCDDSETADAAIYSWQVSGGVFKNGIDQGPTVTVIWDQYETVGTSNRGGLYVIGVIPESFTCWGDDSDTFTKIHPTVEGQIKYWNEAETYMPTPYAADCNCNYPFDYFYIAYYQGEDERSFVEPELIIVEPSLEKNLLSYFEYEVNTSDYGCAVETKIEVWDGSFEYNDDPAGVGLLGNNYTYNNWGGVNATDALAILRMSVPEELPYAWVGWNPGYYTYYPTTYWPAEYGEFSNTIGNVNNTFRTTHPIDWHQITALDALTTMHRSVGLIPSYPDNNSDNMFYRNFAVAARLVDALPATTWDTPFDDASTYDDFNSTTAGNNYEYYTDAYDHAFTLYPGWYAKANYMNIYYEAIGDVNASHVPTNGEFKAEAAMELIYEDAVSTSIDNEVTIPISIDRDVEIGAITLSFNYRNDLIEVIGTSFEDNNVFINHEEGILNIGWFSLDAIDAEADQTIAQIKVRVLAEISANTELFALNANTELADASANAIHDVNLKAIGVTTDKAFNNGVELVASNYPNPFKDATTISYVLPENGNVTVEVYNNVGMKVITLVEEAQEAGERNVKFSTGDIMPGVYIYHITVQGETNNYSAVKRIIVIN